MDKYRLLTRVCQRLLKKSNGTDKTYCEGVLGIMSRHGQESRLAIKSIQDIAEQAKYVLVAVYTVSLAVSFLGNTLVIMSFVFHRHMRSVMNVFIVSLAVSDFLITVTCSPINIGNALAKYWILGGFACKAMPFMTNLSVASSSLTLCCIALDRYNAIVHPLKLNATKNPKRAVILLLCVWVVSISASIPYALLYNIYDICKGDNCESEAHLCYGSDRGLLASLEMWLTLVVLLVLPLSFIAVTYGIVIWRLWSKRTIGARIPTAEDLRTRYKKKAVMMMVLVVVLFACCWTPLLLFDVIGREESLKASQSNLILKYFLQWFALSSACYNPIIYAFMNERFRKNVVKLLTCRRVRVEPVNPRQTGAVRLRTSQQPPIRTRQSEGTTSRF